MYYIYNKIYLFNISHKFNFKSNQSSLNTSINIYLHIPYTHLISHTLHFNLLQTKI